MRWMGAGWRGLDTLTKNPVGIAKGAAVYPSASAIAFTTSSRRYDGQPYAARVAPTSTR